MKVRRVSPLVICLVVAGCASEAGEEGMAENAASEVAATNADEAALDEVRAAYVQHYNLHHAPVVADLYADSSVALLADGSVREGKTEILAWLEEGMAGTPTLDLVTDETRVFGDNAVSLGRYSVESTPPGGAATTLGGHYMTLFNRTAAGWKISAVITNFDATPPADFAWGDMTGDAPPNEGTMTALTDAWAQHFNLGHASVVAGYYADDAKVSFTDRPLVTGKAAVEAELTELIAAGSPQITIHDVYTVDLGGGYAADMGWYELTATADGQPVSRSGIYMVLNHQQPDGTWKIQWHVGNGRPAA